MLGSALHGREAGAAQAGRDGRQDTVPGYGGAGNKTHPQRRDGQGSGPGEVLLQISTQGGRQAALHGTEPHQHHRPARKRLLH